LNRISHAYELIHVWKKYLVNEFDIGRNHHNPVSCHWYRLQCTFLYAPIWSFSNAEVW